MMDRQSLKSFTFENWLGIVFCLFASSLLFSISVMELFASILFIFCIYGIATKKIVLSKREVGLFGVGIILAALFVWTGVSLYQNEKSLARLLDLRWMVWIYLFFICAKTVRFDAEKMKWFAIPILISTIYAVIFFLSPYEPLKGPEYTVHKIGDYLRTGGFLGSPMTFANVVAPIFCFSIGIAIYYLKNNLVGKKWVLISASGLGLSLLLTFTRASWIGAFIGALVIFSFYSWRWVLALIVAASLLFGGLFNFSPAFHKRMTSLTDVNDNANLGRQALWKAHFAMIKDHPVFGVGYGHAKSHLDEYYDRLEIPQDTVKSHAHNQLLHYAAGMGLPGAGLLLLLWISLLFLNWRLITKIPETETWKKTLAIAVLGAQISFYIFSQTEATLEDSEVGYTWTLLIGILFYLMSTKKEFWYVRSAKRSK